MAKSKLMRIEISPELEDWVMEAARQLRRQSTKSEEMLWQALRGRKVAGIRFRRQQPIGPFVVDFYASTCRLVIEVDGGVHQTQVEADQARQEVLEKIGLHVLRLPADLVENNLEEALRWIREACNPDLPA